MGEVKFVGSLVLIMLFTVAVVSFSIGFANDNNSAISISDDSDLSDLNSLVQGDLNQFNVDTNTSSGKFGEASIAGGSETTTTGGTFKLGMENIVDSTKTVMSTAKTKLFGGSNAFGIVFSALGGFLVYVSIRYVWKTWKGGNPD